MQYQTIKNIMIMNEQVFKPIENYVNDFKNHFINTFTSGELSKYMNKENESFESYLSNFIEDKN